jgi:hypothetical protein
MWQITDTVGAETKKLARQTMDVQKISKSMAATEFGISDTFGKASLGTVVAQQRVMFESANKMSDISLRQAPAPVVVMPDSMSLDGTLDLHPNGKITVQGWSSERADSEETYRGTTKRMSRIP